MEISSIIKGLHFTYLEEDRVKFLDLGDGDLTAMKEYPRHSRAGAIRERRCIAAGTLEQAHRKHAKIGSFGE